MAVENQTLQITEHALELDPIEILDVESEQIDNSQPVPSNILGNFYPYIEINSHEFTHVSILSTTLKTSGFITKGIFKLVDTDGFFQARHFALDGAIVNFYIRANNTTLHKPIHLNFDIINIKPSGKLNGSNVFIINCQHKIPNLFTEYCEAFAELTSFEVLQDMATKLSLGFASNVTETSDVMTWINPYSTSMEFIKDVTLHSYKDDNSFFTSYIDTYGNFVFEDVNLILNSSELAESEYYDRNTQNMVKQPDEFEVIPMMFTNHMSMSGSKKIVAYSMVNNTGKIFLQQGYKRVFQHYNMIENTYIPDILIDPLSGETEGSVHMKGRFVNGEPEGLAEEYVKYKYMGKQNENVHDYYLFANLWNYQNLNESSKMGMIIDIAETDMSVRKLSSVLIHIYEYDAKIKTAFAELSEDAPENQEFTKPYYNPLLSGFYVVAGIDYIFRQPGPMYQRLYLIRREFTASF